MVELKNHALKSNLAWLKFLPYMMAGAGIFITTTNAELNPFISAYIVLLQAQAAIVVIYFVSRKAKGLKLLK